MAEMATLAVLNILGISPLVPPYWLFAMVGGEASPIWTDQFLLLTTFK